MSQDYIVRASALEQTPTSLAQHHYSDALSHGTRQASVNGAVLVASYMLSPRSVDEDNMQFALFADMLAEVVAEENGQLVLLTETRLIAVWRGDNSLTDVGDSNIVHAIKAVSLGLRIFEARFSSPPTASPLSSSAGRLAAGFEKRFSNAKVAVGVGAVEVGRLGGYLHKWVPLLVGSAVQEAIEVLSQVTEGRASCVYMAKQIHSRIDELLVWQPVASSEGQDIVMIERLRSGVPTHRPVSIGSHPKPTSVRAGSRGGGVRARWLGEAVPMTGMSVVIPFVEDLINTKQWKDKIESTIYEIQATAVPMGGYITSAYLDSDQTLRVNIVFASRAIANGAEVALISCGKIVQKLEYIDVACTILVATRAAFILPPPDVISNPSTSSQGSRTMSVSKGSKGSLGRSSISRSSSISVGSRNTTSPPENTSGVSTNGEQPYKYIAGTMWSFMEDCLSLMKAKNMFGSDSKSTVVCDGYTLKGAVDHWESKELMTIESWAAHSVDSVKNGNVLYHIEKRKGFSEPLVTKKILFGQKVIIDFLRSRVRALSQFNIGCLVGVSGPQGYGKTAVVMNMADGASRERMKVVYVSGKNCGGVRGTHETELAIYMVIIEKLLGLDEIDDPYERENRFLSYFDNNLALRAILGLLNPYLGLSLPVGQGLPSGIAKIDLVLRIVLDLIVQVTSKVPVLLVIDDVHAIVDEPSILMTKRLVSMGLPKMMLVLCLREYSSTSLTSWLDTQTTIRRVEIESLDPEDITKVAQEYLQVDEVPYLFMEKIIDFAQGSPLVCEQFLSTLLESGAITVSNGKCTVGKKESRLDFKLMTHADILRTRFDGYNPTTKLTLRVASVVDGPVTLALLQHCNPIAGSARIETELQLLVDTGVMESTADLPTHDHLNTKKSAAYRFKHDFMLDFVASNILVDQRIDLHSRVADFYEFHDPPSTAGGYVKLAKHWFQAKRWSRAFHCLDRAVSSSQDSGDPEVAIGLLRVLMLSKCLVKPDPEKLQAMALLFDAVLLVSDGVVVHHVNQPCTALAALLLSCPLRMPDLAGKKFSDVFGIECANKGSHMIMWKNDVGNTRTLLTFHATASNDALVLVQTYINQEFASLTGSMRFLADMFDSSSDQTSLQSVEFSTNFVDDLETLVEKKNVRDSGAMLRIINWEIVSSEMVDLCIKHKTRACMYMGLQHPADKDQVSSSGVIMSSHVVTCGYVVCGRQRKHDQVCGKTVEFLSLSGPGEKMMGIVVESLCRSFVKRGKCTRMSELNDEPPPWLYDLVTVTTDSKGERMSFVMILLDPNATDFDLLGADDSKTIGDLDLFVSAPNSSTASGEGNYDTFDDEKDTVRWKSQMINCFLDTKNEVGVSRVAESVLENCALVRLPKRGPLRGITLAFEALILAVNIGVHINGYAPILEECKRMFNTQPVPGVLQPALAWWLGFVKARSQVCERAEDTRVVLEALSASMEDHLHKHDLMETETLWLIMRCINRCQSFNSESVQPHLFARLVWTLGRRLSMGAVTNWAGRQFAASVAGILALDLLHTCPSMMPRRLSVHQNVLEHVFLTCNWEVFDRIYEDLTMSPSQITPVAYTYMAQALIARADADRYLRLHNVGLAVSHLESVHAMNHIAMIFKEGVLASSIHNFQDRKDCMLKRAQPGAKLTYDECHDVLVAIYVLMWEKKVAEALVLAQVYIEQDPVSLTSMQMHTQDLAFRINMERERLLSMVMLGKIMEGREATEEELQKIKDIAVIVGRILDKTRVEGPMLAAREVGTCMQTWWAPYGHHTLKPIAMKALDTHLSLGLSKFHFLMRLEILLAYPRSVPIATSLSDDVKYRYQHRADALSGFLTDRDIFANLKTLKDCKEYFVRRSKEGANVPGHMFVMYALTMLVIGQYRMEHPEEESFFAEFDIYGRRPMLKYHPNRLWKPWKRSYWQGAIALAIALIAVIAGLLFAY